MSEQINESLAMATVSVASSSEVMSSTKNDSDLLKMQHELSDKAADAQDILDLLKSTKPHEVTMEFGKLVDDNLRRIGVKSVSIDGLESLGYELRPKDFLSQRIAGCESFITDAFKYTKRIMSEVAANVQDRYVLMKESHLSLENRVNLLEQKIKGELYVPEGDITLPYRYWRRIQSRGVVGNKPSEDLRRVNDTTSAIVGNYYRYSLNLSNEVMSFFGRLGGLTEEEVINRLCELPVVLNKHNFKDAMFVDRKRSTPEIRIRRSVVLIGDKSFEVSELVKVPNVTDISSLEDYLTQYQANQHIRFKTFEDGDGAEEDQDLSFTIKPYSYSEVKQVVSTARRCLKLNENSFKEGDNYSLSYKDYQDIVGVIADAEWSESTKTKVHSIFDRVTSIINKEQLEMRSDVSNYITLTINAIISVSEISLGV